MRSDRIIENNKGLIAKHHGLKTEKDIAMATLDVLTDISETNAALLDFFSLIFNRGIVFPGDKVPEQKNGGNGNG